MFKVALVTANIGNFDYSQNVVHQSVPYDQFYYTEENLPYPLPHLDNRLKGKYMKTKTHKVLPSYDVYVWIDGNVEVHSKDFIKDMLEKLKEHDIVISKHPERSTPFEELLHIKSCMEKGDKYLLDRYQYEPFDEELAFYESNIPKDTQLYACGVFARFNNEKLNRAFDEWWDGCIEFSNFDQTYFSYVVNNNKLKVNSSLIFSGDHHKIGLHK